MIGQFNKKKVKAKEKATDSPKSQDKGKDKAPKKERICYECGKSGHFRRDYPDKDKAHDDSEKTAVAARPGAFVHLEAIEERISSVDELACASAPSRAWIVDSGASRHMTPLKEGLEDLRPMQGQFACASAPCRAWIVDSGASRHMTPLKEGLEDLRPMQG